MFSYCSVAVWSSVNVAGTRLADIESNIGKPDDTENWEQIHRDVVSRLIIILNVHVFITDWPKCEFLRDITDENGTT